MKPGTLAVTLSGHDCAEANWLFVREVWIRRWGWLVPLIGIVCGLGLMFAARHLHPDLPEARARSIAVKGVLMTFAFAGLQLFILLRMIMRAGRPMPGSADRIAIRYVWSEQGLAVETEGYAAHYPWAAVRRVVEDHRWLLLCRGGLTFSAIPKSQLDAGTILALKQSSLNP